MDEVTNTVPLPKGTESQIGARQSLGWGEIEEQEQTGWGTSPKLLTPHSHSPPTMDNPVQSLPIRFESTSPLL